MGTGSQWLAATLLAFGAPAGAADAQDQKVILVGAPPLAFRFSEVRTRKQADGLVDMGSLVKIYLLPTDLGGDDVADNIGYVTPDAAERHAAATARVRRLFRAHRIDTVEVLPEYRRDSLVPARIRVRASLGHGGGEPFEAVIEVW